MGTGGEFGNENGRSTVNPKIAIIIPAYNSAATLAETIASLQAQSTDAWEAVIVDDGSDDDTLDIANQLAAADPRITAITQANSGVSAARNAGIAASTAPFIGFVDADDYWFPTFAARIVEILDADQDAGVVFGRAEIRTSEGVPTGIVSAFPNHPIDLELLVATNPAATCSTIGARRATLEDTGGFAEDLRRCEDHHFLLAAYLADWKVVGLDETLVGYRTSPEGLSANLEGMRDSWDAMVDKLGPENLGPTLAAARAEHLFYLARRALRLGRPRETFRYLREAIAADPLVPVKKIAAAPLIVARRTLANRRKPAA